MSWDIFVSRIEGEWIFTKEDLQAFFAMQILTSVIGFVSKGR